MFSLHRFVPGVDEISRQVLVVCFTAGDARKGVGDCLVLFTERIPASLNQQFHQVQRGSFVTVRKPVIRDDPVNQRCRLLVNTPVIAMVRPGKR